MENNALEKEYTIDDLISRLKCPLSGKIFKDPVLASDGNVYEEAELLNHIDSSNDRNLAAKYVDLLPLKSLISFILEKYPELKDEQFKIDNSIYKIISPYNIREMQKQIDKGNYEFLLNFDTFTILKIDPKYYKKILKNASRKVRQYVLNKTTDINEVYFDYDWCLINYAMKFLNANQIEDVVEYGLNINVNARCGGDQWSVAHQVLFYTKNTSLKIIKLLVSKGMDFVVYNKDGNLPFDVSFDIQSYEVIEYILEITPKMESTVCERLISLIYSNEKIGKDKQEKLVAIILTKDSSL